MQGESGLWILWELLAYDKDLLVVKLRTASFALGWANKFITRHNKPRNYIPEFKLTRQVRGGGVHKLGKGNKEVGRLWFWRHNYYRSFVWLRLQQNDRKVGRKGDAHGFMLRVFTADKRTSPLRSAIQELLQDASAAGSFIKESSHNMFRCKMARDDLTVCISS
jgi:hypothetical protein